MPELMLLRHGKSSWDDAGLDDRDRPLAGRGRRDAAAMAKLIAAKYPPDRILCSPARRTRETLAPLLSELREEPVVSIEDDLYDHLGDYVDLIADRGADAHRLLVVGHNPAIQATALALIGSGDKALHTQLVAKFPTGALVVIAFKDNWADLSPQSGRLTVFQRPRDLVGADEDD
jgi:phosphohistidine phosphatase